MNTDEHKGVIKLGKLNLIPTDRVEKRNNKRFRNLTKEIVQSTAIQTSIKESVMCMNAF